MPKLSRVQKWRSKSYQTVSEFSINLFVVLFVSLRFFIPLDNFLRTRRRHHCRLRAANFDLCLARMAIEQWRFFSVPHLLRHTGHLRGIVTHIYCRAFDSGAATTCLYMYDLGLSRLGLKHPTFRLRGERSNPLCHHSCCFFVVNLFWKYIEQKLFNLQDLSENIEKQHRGPKAYLYNRLIILCY